MIYLSGIKKNNFILTLVITLCSLFLIAFAVTQISGIPRYWKHQDMILRYAEGHGLSNEFMHYDFYKDSLHVYGRSMREGRIAEIRYKAKLKIEELNRLLGVLRENHADKLKMRKTGGSLNDGASFSLQLVYGDKFVINLSNSAYEELQASDKTRLKRIADHIHGLVGRFAHEN